MKLVPLSLAPPRAAHQRRCGARRGHRFARSDASRHARGDTAAAARRSKRSLITGEGIVRTQDEAACRTGTRHRRLCRRLPRRRHRAADYRAGLAGDAAVAQPQLGASEAHRLPRGFCGQGQKSVWNGLLVGDMSQPRGGPMLTGHASHQIGLDADIWFKPMPDHVLSREEREFDSAVNMVAADRLDVDPAVWTPARTALLHVAAEDPAVVAHFRQRRDQESDVQRGGTGSRLARQGAAMVGPRRAFPRPPVLPARQPAVQAAAASRKRARLRPRARLLVFRKRVASRAAAGGAGKTANRSLTLARSCRMPAAAS